MQQNGRKSSARLAVVGPVGVVERIAPPRDLSPVQRELWRQIVNTKPADWFGVDSAPVLVEYVRAAETCDMLATQVAAAMESGDVAVIATMLKLRNAEANRVAGLARSLRLTQQSRYTPDAAHKANKGTLHGAKTWAFGTEHPVDREVLQNSGG